MLEYSVPKFKRSVPDQGESESLNSEAKQLESLLQQLFALIKADVEPYLGEEKTKVTLRSYEALTTNIAKSLRR